MSLKVEWQCSLCYCTEPVKPDQITLGGVEVADFGKLRAVYPLRWTRFEAPVPPPAWSRLDVDLGGSVWWDACPECIATLQALRDAAVSEWSRIWADGVRNWREKNLP